MLSTLDIPDELYKHIQKAAAETGISIRDFIVGAAEREWQAYALQHKKRRVGFPLIRSRRPGSVSVTAKAIFELTEPNCHVST